MKLAHIIVTSIGTIIISLTLIGMENAGRSTFARDSLELPDLSKLQTALIGHELSSSNEEYTDEGIRATQRMLINAIVINDSSCVQWCLEQGANPNMGALITADGEQISLLPLSHLDVSPLASSFTTSDKTTFVLYAIHLAVLNDTPEVLALLLEHGARPDVKASNGLQAVHLTEKNGNLDALQLLIKHGAPLEVHSSPETTIFDAAIATDQSDTVEFLVSNGTDSQIQESDSQQSLTYAKHDDALALIALVSNYKADIRAQASHRYISVDVEQEDKQQVEVETSKERHISFKKEKEHGASAQQMEQVKKFLDQQITEQYRKKFGNMTYIHAAAIDGNVEIAQLLVTNGANVNKRIVFSNGLQAIHLAALYGHTDFIKWLASNGADIKATAAGTTRFSGDKLFHKKTGMPQTNNGMQAIHFASSTGHLEVVKLLVESGVEVATQDKSGNQAIHFASCGGHQAIIEWLVSHGADINAKNSKGKQPLDMAYVCKHKKVVKWLKQNMNADKPKKSVLISLPSFRKPKKGIML
jgi:ankyrin repeat protein